MVIGTLSFFKLGEMKIDVLPGNLFPDRCNTVVLRSPKWVRVSLTYACLSSSGASALQEIPRQTDLFPLA